MYCIRICAYNHMRMCIYQYTYMRISIRVYVYWADANLVRIYLSCTVGENQKYGGIGLLCSL